MTQSRIQKIIAQAGIASRRKAEEIILEGRVRINGAVVTELGFKADPAVDRIEVDGHPLEGEALITILMNKPRGVVCTASDPEGRATVMDFVKDIDARVFPVGRLDFSTSGALLLTNDGQLSYALTHPKHKVEKIYLVKVEGKVEESVLRRWRTGVDIGDAVTQPAEVFKSEEDENFTWLQVTLHEGRNRQIRRMAETCGLNIKKLKRISFAGLTIEGIKVGQYRVLSALEIRKLKEQFHVQSSTVRFPRTTQSQQTEDTGRKRRIGESRRPFFSGSSDDRPRNRRRTTDRSIESSAPKKSTPKKRGTPDTDRATEFRFGKRRSTGRSRPVGEQQSGKSGKGK